MTIWILIWRLNPPHFWHMRILDESLKYNNKTILFLGSANIKDDRNPYSFEKRKEFINLLYFDNKDLFIEDLNDLENDKEWIESIQNKLLKYIGINETIIFYGWDLKNDYAIQVIKRYEDLLWYKNIFFKEISRKELDISSTQVREIIKKQDKELMKKLVSKKIIDKIL